jgi:hypothetical protein
MSYDLMVFDPTVAQRHRTVFMQWYDDQTEWKETHGYNDPEVTTPSLKAWLLEMTKTFSAMNGPYARNDQEKQADYNIAKHIIYVTFAWPDALEAHNLTKSLADKHKVGFFDVSADDGAIIIPGIGAI